MEEILKLVDANAFHVTSVVLTVHLVVRFIVIDGIETIAKCREARETNRKKMALCEGCTNKLINKSVA